LGSALLGPPLHCPCQASQLVVDEFLDAFRESPWEASRNEARERQIESPAGPEQIGTVRFQRVSDSGQHVEKGLKGIDAVVVAKP
jgi:hypothetical protein